MAIVGGVLTVFALIDGVIFTGSKRLNGKDDKDGSEYVGLNGKLL